MTAASAPKPALQTGSPRADGTFAVAAVNLHADIAGVVFWPEQGLLAVADLHLEKGSSFAERGVLLPPYDTAATLARLGALIARYAPRVVVALGDSFHDGRGPRGSPTPTAPRSRRCRRAATGSGSPATTIRSRPRTSAGGFSTCSKVGALTFRHEPGGEDEGEVAGHLHPVARVARRGRAVSRRCFACDGVRLVMPAFGAYTGGLNVRDRAFANVFPTLGFTAHMLGVERVYPVAARHCLPD